MTEITQARLREIVTSIAPCNLSVEEFTLRVLAGVGFTIKREPPEAMNAVASRIAYGARVYSTCHDADMAEAGALAALQHIERAVREVAALGTDSVGYVCDAILKTMGTDA